MAQIFSRQAISFSHHFTDAEGDGKGNWVLSLIVLEKGKAKLRSRPTGMKLISILYLFSCTFHRPRTLGRSESCKDHKISAERSQHFSEHCNWEPAFLRAELCIDVLDKFYLTVVVNIIIYLVFCQVFSRS